MQTITLTAGQTTDFILAPGGARVSLSGSGYIKFAPGTIQDAKEGRLTFKDWPLASTAGFCDLARPVVLYAVGTGDCTVTIDQVGGLANDDEVYWVGSDREGDTSETAIPVTASVNQLTGRLINPVGETDLYPALDTLNSRDVVLAGDSRTAMQFYISDLAGNVSATVGSNTVRVHRVRHAMGVGQQYTLMLADQAEFVGCWTVSEVIDSDNFEVTISAPATVITPTGSIQGVAGNAWAASGSFAYLQHRDIEVTFNAGIGGNTTDQLLARFATDVLAKKPSIVRLEIGINDLRSGNKPAQYVADNIIKLARLATNSGIKVMLCTIAPIGATDPFFSTVDVTAGSYTAENLTTPKRIIKVNTLIKRFAAIEPRVWLVDQFSVLVDPTSTTGAAYSWSTFDQVHQSPKAAWAVSRVEDTVLGLMGVPVRPKISSQLDSLALNAGSKNCAENPLMISTGGNVGTNTTGTVAAGFKVTGDANVAAVASLVSRSDSLGKNQKAVLTASAAGVSETNMFLGNSNQFTAGDSIWIEADVSISSATNLSSFSGYFQVSIGGVSYEIPFIGVTQGASIDQFPVNYRYRTGKFVVPAGTIDYIQPRLVEAKFSAAGGATVEIGCAALWKQ